MKLIELNQQIKRVLQTQTASYSQNTLLALFEVLEDEKECRSLIFCRLSKVTVWKSWKVAFPHVCSILLLTRAISSISCALAMEDTQHPIHVDENIVYFVDVSSIAVLLSSLDTSFGSTRVTSIPRHFC